MFISAIDVLGLISNQGYHENMKNQVQYYQKSNNG